MRRLARILALGVVSAMLIGAPVNAAGKPVMERIAVDDTFVDEFLSEACGVEVTTHVGGHVILRQFLDADGNAVREVNNYALSETFESANGRIRVVDVGVDRVTYLADGSIIQVVIGNVQSIQIPGQGRVYSDVGQITLHITFDENGDPIFELTSQHGQHDDDQLEAICSILG